MLWKIKYEISKGNFKEMLADVVEAIDIMDAVEIAEEQNCRLKRAMLGDNSHARIVEAKLVGDNDDVY